MTVQTGQVADFSDDELTVICSLLEEGDAALNLGKLCESLGVPYEKLQDTLADLDMKGFIEYWERTDGLAFTLSPYGAEVLNMKLVETGDCNFMWMLKGEPEPSPLKAMGVLKNDTAWERFESHQRGPVQEAILREETQAVPLPKTKIRPMYRGFDDSGLPFPSILLNKNIHLPIANKICDCCNGVYLNETMYCLKCDRWGMDGRYEKGHVIKDLSDEKRQQVHKEQLAKIKKKQKEKAAKAKELYQEKMRNRKLEQEKKRMKEGRKRANKRVA